MKVRELQLGSSDRPPSGVLGVGTLILEWIIMVEGSSIQIRMLMLMLVVGNEGRRTIITKNGITKIMKKV